MKKNISLFILVITLVCSFLGPNVYAANYEMKELIPAGTKTTVKGEYLLYKDIYYESGFINFSKIRNNSKIDRKITIAVGLFDEDRKNIGVVFYCTDEELSPKEETSSYKIDVKGSYMAPDKGHKDIKYISVLNDNATCRKDGSQDYIGQTVEEIGLPKNTQINDSAKLLLNILTGVVGVLVLLFFYKMFFTTAYDNMDGDDVRQGYAYINSELRKKREREARWKRPEPKVVKTHKTQEIIKQEQEEAKKVQNNDTDLHNFYK